MLEIPETYAFSKQLCAVVKGKEVVKAIAASSPHKFAWFSGVPEFYAAFLEGEKILDCRGFGMYIEMDVTENKKLVLGDGVNIRYFEKGEKLPSKHQLLLLFDDDSALCMSVQMYGGMWTFSDDGSYDNSYYLGAKYKTSVLSDEFDETYFNHMFDNSPPKLSAKAFIATEQRMPGLGNGCAQDILFHAGIHPKRKIGTLEKSEISDLYKAVKTTIKEMADCGGRDIEKDIYGNPGRYKTILSKKTLDFPCPICGGTIKKEAYLGGSIYYCPECQRL